MHRKRQLMETKLKITQILELLHKDIKVTIINMLSNVNKNTLMMNRQIGNLRRTSIKMEIIELKIKYLK